MYNHKEIDAKWQTRWQESKLYATAEDPKKPKQYILDMFPYPSGEGLHVGHPKGYIATDVVSRMRMMQGYNVLHPIGWDAFGLPTENYAIKNKVHPRIATEKNIARFKHQLQMIGFTYDWDREINTTDPKFYRWTQWCFLQMFEKGLAYESYEPINWCPSCKTGLANEDLEDGRCERCGSEIEQKPVRQWVLKITAYAERLLNDLDKLPHWEQSIKDMQRAWIGKSEGAEINFRLTNSDSMLTVFTTRIDTIFGCTYVVIAPEHPLLVNEEICVTNADAVKEYIEETKKKTNLQRAESKEKNGVHLEGIAAINPFTHEEVPIFVADYVIGEYGTGAVMAVPAHDERDFEFAKKHQLPLRKVIVLPEVMSIPRNAEDIAAGATCVLRVESECYTGDGELINSNEFSGLPSAKAREKMISWLETEQCGTRKVNYKIRDWVFSRQRYWGEPIPIIHCDHCGAIPVPLDKLPVLLPEVEHYEPTGTGESPLAAISEWVNTSCPSCKGPGKRETNTMPQWAGSSWYYLRYIDPQNSEQLVDSEKEKYWSPVDLYVGGAEHATRHLIYARFWHKFLYDHGVVNYDEPFMRLKNVGLIMGEDGLKMSKRWGNVVNPDDVVERLGADALRVYEMFMGPFSQAIAWNTNGLAGSRRFLEKVWRMRERVSSTSESSHLTRKTHQTIRKVSEDIEEFRFNTAVSSLMILANEMEKSDRIPLSLYAHFVTLLAPFAPHMAEELWEQMGHTDSIFVAQWPSYDPSLVVEEEVTITLQVNGKLRGNMCVPVGLSREQLEENALQHDALKKWLDGKEIEKIIVVPNKLVNIVVR